MRSMGFLCKSLEKMLNDDFNSFGIVVEATEAKGGKEVEISVFSSKDILIYFDSVEIYSGTIEELEKAYNFFHKRIFTCYVAI